MTYQDYIKIIEVLKLANENRIIGIIPQFEETALEALLTWIDNSISTKNGAIVANDETVEILNSFDSAYMEVLMQIKAYKGAVSGFIKKLPELSSVIKEYQIGNNSIDWGKAGISNTEKVVVNEILKAYTENGLNKEFVQPLRDMLYQNIVAGTNLSEAKKSLKEYIISTPEKSSKIKRYLTQTSQQAVDGYTGAINKRLMNSFNYPYLIMSGSLIITSSPQCRKGIKEMNSMISEKDFNEILKPIAEKNGLATGTTFQNLTFNKLHHGCRHEFTPSMRKIEI